MAQNTGMIQFGGTIPGGEIWACRLQLSAPGGQEAFEASFFTGGLSYVKDAVATWFTTAGTGIAAPVKLTFVKFNEIMQNRRQNPLRNTIEHQFLPVVSGAATSNMLPAHNSLVISLGTGLRGRSTRGRLYMPPMTSAVLEPTTGKITANAQLNAMTTFVALCTSLNAIPGYLGAGRPAVSIYSDVLGTARRVTEIRCGKVMDMQSRRRNALAEDYTAQAVPTPS